MSHSESHVVVSSLKFWFYIVAVLNAVFGIIASTTTIFGPINWLDTTTIILFLAANIALVLLILLVQAATKILQENKVLREQNERLVQGRGFVRLGESTIMVLEYDKDTGKLLYENKRALLLSSETLQEIFEVVKEKDEGGQVLKELGYKVGLAFADRFRQHLKQEYLKIDIELPQQIEKWCDFDSNAGFGKVIDKISVDKNNQVSGELHINWSVLTEDRNSSQLNLCGFMEGYFEGILNRIANNANRDIKVKHIVCDLDSPGKPNLGCKFSITQASETTKA